MASTEYTVREHFNRGISLRSSPSWVQRTPFVSKKPGFAWRWSVALWSTERVYNTEYQRTIQVPGPPKTRVSLGLCSQQSMPVIGNVPMSCSSGAQESVGRYRIRAHHREPAGRHWFVFSQLHESDLCHDPAEKRPRLGLLHSKT